jgi:hypothetical protein
MVNIKAKESYLKAFLDLVEFDKKMKERWNVPGIYFKINKQIIPTYELNLDSLTGKCFQCTRALTGEDP